MSLTFSSNPSIYSPSSHLSSEKSMALVLYKDGSFSSVVKYNFSTYFSHLSRLMIKSMRGNASPWETRVVCLSDYHYDFLQKFIRSRLIQEFGLFKKTEREAIFLLEGVPFGKAPSRWIHERLIGEGLMPFPYLATGWDAFHLNRQGIQAIQRLLELSKQGKAALIEASQIRKAKKRALNINQTFDEEHFEKVDLLNQRLQVCLKEQEEIVAKIESVREEILSLADQRTLYLHRSIKKIIRLYPQADIYVIAGEDHFKHLPSVLRNVKHCILSLHSLRPVENLEEALEEIYT